MTHEPPALPPASPDPNPYAPPLKGSLGSVPFGPAYPGASSGVDMPQLRRRRFPTVPAVLFLATCASTFWVGVAVHGHWTQGLLYAGALMTILGLHEMGHFVQARRYRVPATWPFFIPMPLSPIGTMGAVIAMQPGMGHRRALFDIAVTGPLAGLVPALAATIVGLQLCEVRTTDPQDSGATYLLIHEPLLFRLLAHWVRDDLTANSHLVLHPLAYAGWVGMFITALNLIPISQLDGGHILYALLLRKSRPVATGLLLAAATAVVVFGYWGWSVMLLLLLAIGPAHPPTANDHMPLGTARTVLGWLSLAFVPLGFVPVPFEFVQPPGPKTAIAFGLWPQGMLLGSAAAMAAAWQWLRAGWLRRVGS
jgi:Zn-dependent protease